MLKISDDVDLKTNQIINKTLNYYSSKIKNNNIVIFHQQDDTISMICYTLLKILQNQIHFTLYLYGKHKNTKNMYREDKNKFICKWKAKKLLKLENTILITPYNPIYKVVGEEKIFNYFIYLVICRIIFAKIKNTFNFYYYCNFFERNR